MAKRLNRRKKSGYTAPMGAKGFQLLLRTKPDPASIGAELKRLRLAAGVSVGDLAERMGWISQNVSRLERGGTGREPTLSSVNLYLRTLGYECVIVARPKPPLKRGTPPPSSPQGTDEGSDGNA